MKSKTFNYVSSTKDHKAREIYKALQFALISPNANLYKLSALYQVRALVYDLMQLLNARGIK